MTVHPFLPALEMAGKIRQTVSFGSCSLGWVKFLRHGLAIQSKLGPTIVQAPYLTHLTGIGKSVLMLALKVCSAERMGC